MKADAWETLKTIKDYFVYPLGLDAEDNLVRDLVKHINEGNANQFKELLSNLSPEKQKRILNKIPAEVFINAASNNHLAILVIWLNAVTPTRQIELIEANGFQAFRKAAENGHELVARLLFRKAGQVKKQEMIESYHFWAFWQAACHGHESVVRLLLSEIDPAKKQEMIESRGFCAFFGTALDGHESVVRLLLSEVDPAKKQELIESRSFFDALVKTAENGHESIVALLLRETDAKQRPAMLNELRRTLIVTHKRCSSRLLNILAAYTDLEVNFSPEDRSIFIQGLNVCLTRLRDNVYASLETSMPLYRTLIMQTSHTCLGEIVNQGAILKLVCRDVAQGFASINNHAMCNGIFDRMCSFLGMPQGFVANNFAARVKCSPVIFTKSSENKSVQRTVEASECGPRLR